MKMKNLLTLLFLFAAFTALAQQGTIRGKVTDAKTGEEIIGANVVIKGTATGASSSITGDYVFGADAGTYTIETSYIGYQSFYKEGVVVSVGEVTTLDITIAEDVEALAEVVVEAKADKASENILLMQRKEAAIAIESIGSRELSARGVSDVKAGLVKMSGVSQVSSRGVYVRGLGDRYNNAYLNGLPLPSPNPNLKVIELDLFPTSIVRNIDVSKTYQVSQFGDMSGASVNILTKDAAEEDYLQFGIGLNYNTQATFNNFLSNRQGTAGYFGFAADKFKSPIPVDFKEQYTFSENTRDPFNTNFSPKRMKAPLDNSYNLQAGKLYKFANSTLGITLSGAYKNSYRYDEGINNVLNAVQLADRDFTRQRYHYKTNLTGLLGAQYSLGRRHYFNLNYLFINNSDNAYIASQGNTLDQDDPANGDVRRLRSRYVQTNLQDIQLLSRHELSDNLDLRWGSSFAAANTNEPDRLDLAFTTAEGVSDRGQIVNPRGSSQNQRYFQTTDEREIYGFAEASYSLGAGITAGEGYRHRLSLGYQLKNKTRQEALRSFQLAANGGFAGDEVNIDQLDELFTDAAYAAGQYSYVDAIADGSSQAQAERLIHAPYAHAELNLSRRLKVVPGLRMEYTDQTVFYKRLGTSFSAPFKEAKVQEISFLPALNMKYSLTDKHVLRFAGSKTLTRPNFRELIPVPFVNENLQSITGRPSLTNSKVYNLDLKYDVYPKAGELASIGAFYKYIDNPIEQIQNGVNFITYFNMPSATAYGLELEVSKRIGSLFKTDSKVLRRLLFDGNISLMKTAVNTDPEDFKNDEGVDTETRGLVDAVTNSSRTLQGASAYIANLSVGYDELLFANAEESNIRLTYNRFGRRIYSVGVQGAGDVYELPFATLDFVIQNTWKSGLGVKVSAKNLLNPKVELEQSAGPDATLGNVVQQSYRAGINLGLSVTYRLNFDR